MIARGAIEPEIIVKVTEDEVKAADGFRTHNLKHLRIFGSSSASWGLTSMSFKVSLTIAP